MKNEQVLRHLSDHIRDNGGVECWARAIGIAPSSMYAKLNGRRRINPDEAVLIEEKSKGLFSKEQLIFGQGLRA